MCDAGPARNARQHPLSRVPAGSFPARRPMLETVMYLGIGFLCAALIGRATFHRIHGRAARLTKRRLDAAKPSSLFGRKRDALGRLSIKRNAQQAEITALKIEVEGLKARLTAERDVASRDGGRGSSDRGIGSAREKHDFSAGLRTAEPSIDVFPRPAGVENDEFASERPSIGRRARRTFVRLCMAFAIGVGVKVAWQDRGVDVNETSPPAPAFVGVAASPEVQAPAVARDPGDVRPRADQPATRQEPQPAVTREQPAAKPEQVARAVATPQAVEQDAGPKTSSSARRPWPDTRPTTIPGWTLREVTKSTVVLQGPSGVWRVTRGDTVPGVGRVESVVRWGKRWLVATTGGLISTP